MIWIVVIFSIFLFSLLAIILTKLTVLVNFYHGQDNDDLTITFKVWLGLITYKLSVPLIKIDKDSPSILFKDKIKSGSKEEIKKEEVKKFSVSDLLKDLHDVRELMNHVIDLHGIVRNFASKVTVKNIEWRSNVGIGDAAYTGMLVGALWTAKSGIISIISHYMRLKQMPIISITPNFQRAISQTQFKCMFQFRIGNAIFAGIKLVKYWKGGRPKFKSTPLSKISKDKTNTV